MTTSKQIVHAVKTGEEIQCQVNSCFRMSILQINVNFNPIVHVDFAYNNICSILGVKLLTGVRPVGKNKGCYSFLLSKNYDTEALEKDIKQQFENYFIQF